MAQRAEHQIQMAEILGSMLTGVTFCCSIIFGFKSFDANIAIIANFVCLWKTRGVSVIYEIHEFTTLRATFVKHCKCPFHWCSK